MKLEIHRTDIKSLLKNDPEYKHDLKILIEEFRAVFSDYISDYKQQTVPRALKLLEDLKESFHSKSKYISGNFLDIKGNIFQNSNYGIFLTLYVGDTKICTIKK